jgi:hypothetical protein
MDGAQCYFRCERVHRDYSVFRAERSFERLTGLSDLASGGVSSDRKLQEIGSKRTMASRTLASTRLLHACRCAAGRCCQASAARPPSRPRCRHTTGLHRLSGFPRSARSGGRRRAGRGAGFPKDVAAASGPRSLPARGSLRIDSQSAGSGASGTEAEGRGLRAASAASFSICFGVGMRQLAGRSVISN